MYALKVSEAAYRAAQRYNLARNRIDPADMATVVKARKLKAALMKLAG